MNSLAIFSAWVMTALVAGSQAASPTTGEAAVAKRVPIIYGSDLYHPHGDPDDHFDLATLFSLPELDVQAVLLDQGDRYRGAPGKIPLEQMFSLTGRRAPYAIGLSKPLKSTKDTGEDQPADNQGAIDLLLRTLEASDDPVTLIMVGSVRDVCAAYNRKPELLRDKVGRLYLNMGNAADGREYNVDLDVHAYVGLMRSGLPIYWCPCMPREHRDATFWKFAHKDVLPTAPEPLQRFFIYALQRVDPREIEPQAALKMNLRPWRQLVLRMQREMWSTASFLDAAGRSIYQVGDQYVAARQVPPGAKRVEVYAFVPARVEIDDQGKTAAEYNASNANMKAFRQTDPAKYAEALPLCLRDLLKRFPLAREFQNCKP